jgi:hypothetical protein
MTIGELLEMPPPLLWKEAYKSEDPKLKRQALRLMKRLGVEPPPVSRFKPRQFSHRETLEISGLTNATLQTWFARKMLTLLVLPTEPGRGNRRRYFLLEVLGLAAMKALTQMNIPVTAAAEHALHLVVSMMALIDEVRDMPPSDAGVHFRCPEIPMVIGFYPAEEAPLGGWAGGGYGAMPLSPRDSIQELHQWFNQDRLTTLLVLDLHVLTAEVVVRAAKILKARKPTK